MTENAQEVAPIEFSTFLKALESKQLQRVVFEGKESDDEAHLKVVNFKNSFGKTHSVVFVNERLEADAEGFLEVAQLIQEPLCRHSFHILTPRKVRQFLIRKDSESSV